MLWILLALVLLLWVLKFGIALTGLWLTLLMIGAGVFFLATLVFHHERH